MRVQTIERSHQDASEHGAVVPQPEANPASSWRSLILRGLIRAIASGTILYLIFTIVPLSEVRQALGTIDLATVPAALLLLVVERYLAARRAKILTDQNRMPLTTYDIFEINTISIFYGMFLPGTLAAGAVRWYKMSRPGGKRAEALAVIVFERLVDAIGLVALGLVFWLLDDPPLDQPLKWIFLILLGGLLVGLVLCLNRRVSAWLLQALARLPGFPLRDLIIAKIRKVMTAIAQYREISGLAMAAVVVLTLGRHVFSTLMLYCFVLGLEIEVSLVAFVWMRSVVNIVTMLPLTIAGLGLREGSLVLMLGLYGVSASSAIALSLLILMTNVFVAVAGGLLELKNMLLGRRRDVRTSSDPLGLHGHMGER